MAARYQFPFKENYFAGEDTRLHYVDEGSGPPVLLVHGNLESSYFYRKLIPPLLAAGFRCVAPDLLGFGLSDKPVQESAHSLQRHVALVTALVEQLGLRGVTTAGGDWGGPISLRYAIEHRDNVRALVILGTFVRPIDLPLPFELLFRSSVYSSFLVRRLDLFRRLMYTRAGFRRRVDPQAMAEIKRAHPDAASRAGLAAFPKMIPTDLQHPNGAYIAEIDSALAAWDVPALVMFADKDMAFDVREGRRIAGMMPNGRFQLIEDAGHFLTEDAGDEVASRMLTFLREEAGVVP